MAFKVILYQVILMLILMLLGTLLVKIKMLDDKGVSSLTEILLNVVSPCVAIISFQLKFSSSLLRGLLFSAAAAGLIHIVSIVIGTCVFNKKIVDGHHGKILKFASVYSNCGYIGIPLLAAVMGTQGIFYASVYGIVFTIFQWTHGVLLFTGKTDRKALVKALINPNVIAIVIGLFLFCFSIKLPALLYDSMNYVFNLNTPLSMIVIGSHLAQIDFRHVFKDKWIWPGVALRNLLIPFAAIFLLHLAGAKGTLLMACLIPIACPVAGTTVLFSDLFHEDAKFPTLLMAASTVLSIVTIPFVVYLVSALRF
ncbi:MAG TPA: AEC family transporter [Clostridia bacterium]|nr:AEC family transporter [Clostridia bacterium]